MSARSLCLALAAGGLTAASLLSVARADPPPLPPPTGPADGGAEPAITITIEQPDGGAPPATEGTAPATAAPQDDPGRKQRFSLRGAGGFQYQQVNGIPVTGARVRLGAGTQNDRAAHYAGLSLLYGSTENDLRTWDLRLGYTGDLLRLGVLRLGVTAEVGYLFIRRATVDERMYALGAGGGVHAGVDLFPFGPRGDHAVTAEARFDMHLHFGIAFAWGPSVFLGFRY